MDIGSESMDLKDKNVLVIGAAVSGIPAVRFLISQGAKVILNDSKKIEALKDVIDNLCDVEFKLVSEGHPIELAQECDFAILSPGVPLDMPLVKELKRLGKEAIAEIELGYRFAKAPILAITGTNGKTTITMLLGEIIKADSRKAFITGNVGNALVGEVLFAKENDFFVTEVSSFQLESIVNFRPTVAVITNITPDHLDRHKTMEGYTEAKLRIFENQEENDFAILNWDNELTRGLKSRINSKVLYFSRSIILEEGAWVENNEIWVSLDGKKDFIIKVEDIFIPGAHNVENVLAASLMAYCAGVSPEIIGKAVKNFKGVEHRVEYVDEIDGVIYYNDSKGTNPDASIKAIEAMKRPTVLIAGGYDKSADFDSFIKSFGSTVKWMILLGETKNKIAEAANQNKFLSYEFVENIEEAVKRASEVAVSGDCVLLSPACASWDMFKNFEQRGRIFKESVYSLTLKVEQK